jgi:hypothetical protein
MAYLASSKGFATHGNNIMTCHAWLFINNQEAITHVRREP